MTINLAVSMLWFIALTQCALLLLLYRQVGRTLLRRAEAIALDGPSFRKPLPSPVAAALAGHRGETRIPAELSGAVIIFARPACSVCVSLWPALREFMSERPSFEYYVVLSADSATTERYARDNGIECPVLSDPRERLFNAGRVRVTPFAVVTDRAFDVQRKGIVNNSKHLASITQLSGDSAHVGTAASRVGRRIDAVELAR